MGRSAHRQENERTQAALYGVHKPNTTEGRRRTRDLPSPEATACSSSWSLFPSPRPLSQPTLPPVNICVYTYNSSEIPKSASPTLAPTTLASDEQTLCCKHEAGTTFLEEPQQNGTWESVITHSAIKYGQKACRRNISETLTGIKMLGASGVCFLVVICLNHWRIQLRPRWHPEAPRRCGLQLSISQSSNERPRTGRWHHLSSRRHKTPDSSQNVPNPSEKDRKLQSTVDCLPRDKHWTVWWVHQKLNKDGDDPFISSI